MLKFSGIYDILHTIAKFSFCRVFLLAFGSRSISFVVNASLSNKTESDLINYNIENALKIGNRKLWCRRRDENANNESATISCC